MKMKIALITYAVISLAGLLILLARENVYIILALIAGVILLGHREIWSLIRHRRLPIVDERIKENLANAMRLTGVFFFITSIVLLLLIRFSVFHDTSKELVISGEFVIIGVAYVISYFYFDRVRPNLGEKALRWLKICLTTAGLSLSTIAFAIALHNLINYWFSVEDAFFFILGLLAAPGVLTLSLLGSLIIYIKGLFSPRGESEPL